MSRPMVVIACMTWLLRIVGPYRHPHPWHSRAGGGAVHSIESGPPICALTSTVGLSHQTIYQWKRFPARHDGFIKRHVCGFQLRLRGADLSLQPSLFVSHDITVMRCIAGQRVAREV